MKKLFDILIAILMVTSFLVFIPNTASAASDWLGISSSHRDSDSGDYSGHTLAEALDGTDYWWDDDNQEHWFILDLGSIYTIEKLRGRSSSIGYDPIDVDVYVSNSKSDWGTAVAEGITTWQDGSSWVEVDSTDKDGRYIKVVIIDTEDGDNAVRWGPTGSFYEIFDAYGSSNHPLQSNPNPSDGGTNIDSNPTLNVTVSDPNGDTMNATWWSNSSGAWVQFASNNSFASGDNISQTTTNFSSCATKYYWSVNVTDGHNHWTNNTYSFTTACNWLGISSSYLDSDSGDDGNNRIEEALDGTDYWRNTSQVDTHWFILDFGETYSIKKVRGRSDMDSDPIDVDVYVSNSKSDWGTAVAEGITTWQDGSSWVEVDSTDKDGRYIKVEIISTEGGGGHYLKFGSAGGMKIFDVCGEAATGGSSNTDPAQSGESPTNATTDISVNPNLYVLVTDADGDNMNATWWSNSSGAWVQFASNGTIANNTNITQTPTNFSGYSTTYYWSLNLTDDNGGWTNDTYHFTTEAGTISFSLNTSTAAFGTVSLGTSAITSGNKFNLTNDGDVAIDVTIQVNDSTDWTYVTYANHDDVDEFTMNFTTDAWSSETNIAPTGTEISNNLAVDASVDFGLRLYMPSSSTVGSEQSWKVYISCVAH